MIRQHCWHRLRQRVQHDACLQTVWPASRPFALAFARTDCTSSAIADHEGGAHRPNMCIKSAAQSIKHVDTHRGRHHTGLPKQHGPRLDCARRQRDESHLRGRAAPAPQRGVGFGFGCPSNFGRQAQTQIQPRRQRRGRGEGRTYTIRIHNDLSPLLSIVPAPPSRARQARPAASPGRGSNRAAAATSPTRADLPRPRRWRGQACTAGAGPRGREGRHAEGMREAEEAARASRTGRRGAWHLQRVHDRLGVRSSAMTKATTQPAVRAEGRSPRRARSPPGWRIETSLRRKGVRGGGSRRACGAKGVRGGGSRRACGAPVCGKRERRVQAEPLSAADSRARAWMGQDGETEADAPHASSRARRVERRLVGASVGAFGCGNANTACQRDVDGSIQATCIVTGW